MPRGTPNAKKDETGLKFTTFHVPLGCVSSSLVIGLLTLTRIVSVWLFEPSVVCGVRVFGDGAALGPSVIRLNPKNTGSTYIKSDANTLWARNAARRAKEPAPATEV